MPEHLQDYWEKGGYIWGLLWICPRQRFRDVAESIWFIWEVSEAEEWINKLDWIPF